jgi:hypothetical protein
LRVYYSSVSPLGNRKAIPLTTSLMFCAVSATAAIAMDRGQFANVPLEVREWFEHLGPPMECCVALTLMVTTLATIRSKINIGFPSKASGIQYHQRR